MKIQQRFSLSFFKNGYYQKILMNFSLKLIKFQIIRNFSYMSRHGPNSESVQLRIKLLTSIRHYYMNLGLECFSKDNHL